MAQIVTYLEKDNIYIVSDSNDILVTLQSHNTIGDGRCYFAAVFGAIYRKDYTY